MMFVLDSDSQELVAAAKTDWNNFGWNYSKPCSNYSIFGILFHVISDFSALFQEYFSY